MDKADLMKQIACTLSNTTDKLRVYQVEDDRIVEYTFVTGERSYWSKSGDLSMLDAIGNLASLREKHYLKTVALDDILTQIRDSDEVDYDLDVILSARCSVVKPLVDDRSERRPHFLGR